MHIPVQVQHFKINLQLSHNKYKNTKTIVNLLKALNGAYSVEVAILWDFD